MVYRIAFIDIFQHINGRTRRYMSKPAVILTILMFLNSKGSQLLCGVYSLPVFCVAQAQMYILLDDHSELRALAREYIIHGFIVKMATAQIQLYILILRRWYVRWFFDSSLDIVTHIQSPYSVCTVYIKIYIRGEKKHSGLFCWIFREFRDL